MDDRVRIYELARQMNLPSPEVITALRELGYDVKSHSSTVDKQAVGQLINHLGKKKQKPEPVKPAAAKPGAKPSPTPAPVVKPRVIGRYRPASATDNAGAEAATSPATETPAAPDKSLPGAQFSSSVIASKPGKSSHPPAASPTEPDKPGEKAAEKAIDKSKDEKGPAQNLAAESTGNANPAAAKVAEVESASASEDIQSKGSGKNEQTKTEAEKTEHPAGANQQSQQEIEAPPVEEIKEEQKEEKRLEEKNTGKPMQAVRPMSPSIPTPTRIGVPSLRATQPRPPKHRPGTTERHSQKREEKAKPSAATVEIPKEIALTGSLTVKELAEKMVVGETEIIKRLMMKGFMRTINQLVEHELARELAGEMGYALQDIEEIKLEEALKQEEKKAEERRAQEDMTDDEKAALVSRPPVVTIMGHVDHGKTSLLDAIRQTKFLLTDAEAGGITQHIGAYHVEVQGEDGQMRQIVFLDTPGHEAFTAMRARGARSTDIAILVVAADDGVMPQTIEAIDHAKAAGVPLIVAVNKIDKAGADPDRVLSQLMEHGLLPDRFGGETVTVNVSAKKRTGLDELLEMILLVADMQDLKANPEKAATGVIIEAELHRGKGAVATALVQNGTLQMGDIIVAGSVFGRVRALLDDRAKPVKAAGPSMPVEVLGLPEVPQAGDRFEVVADLQTAKHMAESRKLEEQEKRSHRITLESLHDLVEQGEVKDLNIIVKADVLGTAEAIADQVRKLSTKEVQVRVLRAATGEISENDVNLAVSSNAIVIGFNVQADNNATRAAEGTGTEIRTYNIIYEIIDNLELAIQGLLQPIREEVQLGTAEVRQVFKVGKSQVIAGCYIINGKVQRGSIARVERAGQRIYDGKIDTLKRFKDDVKEVAQGFECGISCDKLNDVQEGDLIHSFIIQERKREK